MKRIVNCGTSSLKALALAVAVGVVAHASLPYLPLTGPPPLRMLAAKNPATSLKTEAPPPPAATNTLAAMASQAFPGTTNATGSEAASSLPGAGLFPGLDMDKSLEETFSASVFALPTPDLLSISPQMLATYFHPVRFGTNSALTGPFHIGFMPPVPPALVVPMPDKSSHAEYIVK